MFALHLPSAYICVYAIKVPLSRKRELQNCIYVNRHQAEKKDEQFNSTPFNKQGERELIFFASTTKSPPCSNNAPTFIRGWYEEPQEKWAGLSQERDRHFVKELIKLSLLLSLFSLLENYFLSFMLSVIPIFFTSVGALNLDICLNLTRIRRLRSS